MRNTRIALALVAAIWLVMPTSVRAQSTETSNPDEKVIRQTLDDLSTAVDKRDLNAFASYFVQSPDLYYQITTPENKVLLARGIDNMKKMVGGYMKSAPATTASVKPAVTNLRIVGNVAFANWSNPGNQDFLVLEKQGSAWKISALNSQYFNAGNFIEVK
jgi:hypothetical protein